MTPADRKDQPGRLVLASASPRRRELLAALGIPFTVRAADLDESIGADEPAVAAVTRLALAKAEAVAACIPHATVIGADTVVVLAGQILGKPADSDEATAMLRSLRGREHSVVTGVAVVDGHAARRGTRTETTHVRMRDYTEDEIARSIAAGTPFDKAGGYAIQGEALRPVAAIDGCYCNVVGLPLWTLRAMLLGLTPLTPSRPDAFRPVCRDCPLAHA